MQEVAARGGDVILLTDESGAASGAVERARCIVLPHMPEILTPIVYAIPLQLLAYHTAIQMGTDVDQPQKSREIGHGRIRVPFFATAKCALHLPHVAAILDRRERGLADESAACGIEEQSRR